MLWIFFLSCPPVPLLTALRAFIVFVLYSRDGANARVAHPKTSIASATSSVADFYKNLSPNRGDSSPEKSDSLAVDKEQGPNQADSSPDKSYPLGVDKERGPNRTGSLNKNASLDVALDPTRVAMIIEMRHIPHLAALLVYFIGTLPPAWIVQLVGNEEAFASVKKSSALSGAIQSGKLVLRDLPPYYEVATGELLSITLTNLTFYTEFVRPAEWLLIFQTDSIICAASNQSIDDWVEKGYDWAGAPWSLDMKGGNGGFSLRHVPPIVELLKNPSNARPTHADMAFEDFWLSSRLENLPSPLEMSTFSVESVYNEQPLGYHLRGSGILIDSEIWSNETRKRQIFDYCPEVKLILPQLDFK